MEGKRTTQAKRGIIVVDSSSLFYLDALVPAHLRSDPTSSRADMRYVNIFRVLGAQGFEVIVPEMVAIECAETTADGTCVSDLFSQNARPLHRGCAEFIRDAARGAYTGVRVVKVSSSSPASLFCDKVRAALSPQNRLSAVARRELVMSAQEERKKIGKDLGEDHCFEIIRSLNEPHCDVPVYYLSDDNRSYRHIRDCAGIVNTLGVLDKLHLSGLLADCGLKDTGAGTTLEHFKEIVEERIRNGTAPRTRRIDHIPSIDDSKATDGIGEFERALRALRQDMAANAHALSSPVVTSQVDRRSPLEKFKSKYRQPQDQKPDGPIPGSR